MQEVDITGEMAYLVFIIALALTIYFRERSRKLEKITGKRIRSIYRKAWVEDILKRDEPGYFFETMRNNIMVSTALLSAIIISFGFVLNAGIIKTDGEILAIFRIISIIALLGYSLFMIILEIRTLTYIPIISRVPESIIKKYEMMDKVSYMAKLLHESFDYFSNSIRALFYIAPLLIWTYNIYLFIIATLIISYTMYREDYGKESGITIF